MNHQAMTRRVPLWDLFVYYLRLGAIGFGGPVALVGQMEKELVQERRWFGCDLGHLVPPGLTVERWDDVPLVSDGFPAARDAIVKRVQQLLDRCEAAGEGEISTE